MGVGTSQYNSQLQGVQTPLGFSYILTHSFQEKGCSFREKSKNPDSHPLSGITGLWAEQSQRLFWLKHFQYLCPPRVVLSKGKRTFLVFIQGGGESFTFGVLYPEILKHYSCFLLVFLFSFFLFLTWLTFKDHNCWVLFLIVLQVSLCGKSHQENRSQVR